MNKQMKEVDLVVTHGETINGEVAKYAIVVNDLEICSHTLTRQFIMDAPSYTYCVLFVYGKLVRGLPEKHRDLEDDITTIFDQQLIKFLQRYGSGYFIKTEDIKSDEDE